MTIQFIHILAFIGLFLSIYFLYVKRRSETSPSYKPLCDVSEKISCTSAVESKYSTLFIIPNVIYGILFYSLVLLLAYYNLIVYIFYGSILAAIASLYLLFLSYKGKIVCIVCLGTHLINFLLLLVSYRLFFS